MGTVGLAVGHLVVICSVSILQRDQRNKVPFHRHRMVSGFCRGGSTWTLLPRSAGSRRETKAPSVGTQAAHRPPTLPIPPIPAFSGPLLVITHVLEKIFFNMWKTTFLCRTKTSYLKQLSVRVSWFLFSSCPVSHFLSRKIKIVCLCRLQQTKRKML